MPFQVVEARELTVLVDLVEGFLSSHHRRGRTWTAEDVIAEMGQVGLDISRAEMDVIGPVLVTRGVITGFP